MRFSNGAAILYVFALCCWILREAKCDSVATPGENSRYSDDPRGNAGQQTKVDNSDEGKGASEGLDETADWQRNINRSSMPSGAQRRLSVSSAPRRDTQLLTLLAARRRQLLTERLGAHLATIATFASKPEKHNITNAHLEIRDSNNTVIRRISLPENRTSNGESRTERGHSNKGPFRIDSPVPKYTTQIPESRSAEIKSMFTAKALQDAKVIRAGFLNNRRKPASEVIRFAPGTRRPLIDVSAISHDTLGIPESRRDIDKLDDKDDADVILDPDEEFQVDESNHGIYLYNYTTNATTVITPNDSVSTPINDIEALNISLTTKPSLIEEAQKPKVDIKLDEKIQLNVKVLNNTLNATKTENSNNSTKSIKLDTSQTTIKPVKVEAPGKENENNTLFLTDELYNHFRPLESELPVEDMAPFLFFGQKITINIPKENITQLQLTPTKPTHYTRQHEKKRGSYRPVTEKIVSEENEDEINENMDVSVVKNVIEKNKIRNTVKMQAPSRHANLVSAYRKQQTLNATTPSTTTAQTVIENQTLNEDLNDTKVKIKDEALNKTFPTNFTRVANRTYYNFRRKPAKLIQLNTNTTEKEVLTITTTSLPSTVIYTAVVTSVSVTSSIKALNKTDAKNETLPALDDTLTKLNDSIAVSNSTTTVKNIDLLTADSTVNTTEKTINITNEVNNDDRKKNETAANKFKKKPEIRQRLSTIRPRIRFTPPSKAGFDGVSQPSPTPFILYSNRSRSSPITIKYRHTTTTERTSNPDVSSAINPTSTAQPKRIEDLFNASSRAPSNTQPKTCSSSNGCGTEIKDKQIIFTTTQDHRAIDTVTDTNIYKINNNSEKVSATYNNTNKNNSYFFINNSATVTTSRPDLKIEDIEPSQSNEVNDLNSSINQKVLNDKDLKEVLERRNNEVLIEMEKTNMTTYILAGLGFLPLTIIVMFVLRHVFLKKTKDIDTDYEGYFQDSEVKKETQITTVARPPMPPPKKPDQKWEFPRNKLRLQTLLGQGNFGQVWKAEADDLTGHDGLTRLVAVKTIKEAATQKEKQELLHEICIMQKVGTHPNVVTLLACCTEQEPYLLIMEYVMCGKLLTYLRDRRSRVDRFQMPRGGLTSRDLTVFAYCVARGMDYLASKGIVHRDLAARNVLVDHNKLCKIADFGMSKDITSTDDKSTKPQRNALPVRWMAPEALLYSVYSHETDVWAYGVLLWEIVTLGSTPYATMSGREVLHMVTEGYRLERPAHCKPHLYQTMHACWHADPAQRPPFSDIKKQLSELLENEPTEGNYVDLESFYQDSSVYSDPSAIIENDGGISIEYSGELSSKLRDDIPRRSFHIPNATNLQRNFSAGNALPRTPNFRKNDSFNTVRAGNHTSVGGFGIMDGGFSGRDGNFCDREKLSGSSFHRERERERETNVARENGHPGNSLISRNSFNGIGNQSSWGGRPFLAKSGSSRSKRISEFECNI